MLGNTILGAGEMAQCLRVNTAPRKEGVLFLTSREGGSQLPVIPIPKTPMPASGLCRQLHACAHTPTRHTWAFIIRTEII